MFIEKIQPSSITVGSRSVFAYREMDFQQSCSNYRHTHVGGIPTPMVQTLKLWRVRSFGDPSYVGMTDVAGYDGCHACCDNAPLRRKPLINQYCDPDGINDYNSPIAVIPSSPQPIRLLYKVGK